MKFEKMTLEEMSSTKVGEMVTLMTVMTIATIAVMVVVVYQLFLSKKGTAAIPGGWKFTWN